MTGRVDGGPAFPTKGPYGHVSGMSLRDYYAGQLLSGYGATGIGGVDWEIVARAAYKASDAMIAARSKDASNPLQKELDEAKARIEGLEQLRPHWAQGYSSDSIAAQSSTSALLSLWTLLGAPHQTAAVERVKQLLAGEASQ